MGILAEKEAALGQLKAAHKDLKTRVRNGEAGLDDALLEMQHRKRKMEQEVGLAWREMVDHASARIPELAVIMSGLAQAGFVESVEVLELPYRYYQPHIDDPTDTATVQFEMGRHLASLSRCRFKRANREDLIADFFHLYRVHLRRPYEHALTKMDLLQIIPRKHSYDLTVGLPLPSAPEGSPAPPGCAILPSF